MKRFFSIGSEQVLQKFPNKISQNPNEVHKSLTILRNP